MSYNAENKVGQKGLDEGTIGVQEEQILSLIFQYRIKYISYIRSIICDYHLSEDVYQSVSLEAIRSADKFQNIKHLQQWLWVACRTRALNVLREQNKPVRVFDNEMLDIMQPFWEARSPYEQHEIFSYLEKCLGRLSAYAREIIHFRYRENLTGQKLADALGRKCESVYVALSRVHRALAECIQRQSEVHKR
jgi:RNA polymerase sigma-70 factor (ECF subfamily)